MALRHKLVFGHIFGRDRGHLIKKKKKKFTKVMIKRAVSGHYFVCFYFLFLCKSNNLVIIFISNKIVFQPFFLSSVMVFYEDQVECF